MFKLQEAVECQKAGESPAMLFISRPKDRSWTVIDGQSLNLGHALGHGLVEGERNLGRNTMQKAEICNEICSTQNHIGTETSPLGVSARPCLGTTSWGGKGKLNVWGHHPER